MEGAKLGQGAPQGLLLGLSLGRKAPSGRQETRGGTSLRWGTAGGKQAG